MTRICRVGDVALGPGNPLAIIAGPCTLEWRELAIEVAEKMRDACAAAGLSFIFKASFDKANRTSADSPRGPGLERGLSDLIAVRDAVEAPITTDVHDPAQAAPVARVVDLLQIPAFLCRQTDLLHACGAAAVEMGRAVNVKKGQFVSPTEMVGPVQKLAAVSCDNVMLTERGTFFGYHRLVNDFIGLGDLMELPLDGGAVPVCFDCTHSTQQPGAGATSGGRPERAGLLAKAAVAAGVHAIFMECHPQPSRAFSDAATMLQVDEAASLVFELAALRAALAPASSRS